MKTDPFQHAKERLYERYKLTISNAGLKELSSRIELHNEIKQIENNGNRIVCLIDYKDNIVKCVYNRTSKQIITFLPVSTKELEEIYK